MIKLLSLFSGIGAFEAALRRGGYQFETVNYCEIDPYASKAYSQIHDIPEGKNLHDVREINPLLLDNINLVTFGFPCQDISVAGKQKGFEHDGERTRSGLFFEALRIIEFLQPEYAIAENVKALTSKKFEKEFNTVLSSLAEVGYNNYWKVLNAKDFGIPQNRERIFIISIRKDIDTGTFTFPEKQPLQLRVKDMLEPEVDEKFYINSDRAKKLIEKITATPEIVGGGIENRIKTIGHLGTGGQKGWVFNINGISRYLAATDYKDPTKIIETKVVGNLYGRSQRARIISPEGLSLCLGATDYKSPVKIIETRTMIEITEPKVKQVGNIVTTGNFENPQRGRVYDCNGISPTLNTMQGGGLEPKFIQPVVIGSTQQHASVNTDGTAPCLTAMMGLGGGNVPMVTEPQILKYERTEYGKQIRNQYEKGEINERRSNMREFATRTDGVSNTLTTVQKDNYLFDSYRIRKLTPLECFRLMGFSDEEFNRIKGVSNTQLYKMAGNSIVVNVLEAIFRQLFKENHKE